MYRQNIFTFLLYNRDNLYFNKTVKKGTYVKYFNEFQGNIQLVKENL